MVGLLLGRIVFKGPGTDVPAERMGILDTGEYTEYILDLTELPNAPSYWRFNGLNATIADAVGQLCEDAGYDWTVELLPVNKPVDDPEGSPTTPTLFINIKTADRTAEPTSNTLQTFIDHPNFENLITNYDKGQELRNELTQTLVIGGPKQTFYQAELVNQAGVPNMIMPYFGLNPDNGNAIIPVQDSNGFWNVELYTDELNVQLQSKYGLSVPRTITVTEPELIAAQAGYDVWSSYCDYYGSDLWNGIGVIGVKGIWDVEGLVNLINQFNNPDPDNKPRPQEILSLRNGALPPEDDLDYEIAQVAFSWISKIVSEFYGSQFMVRVPFTCAKTDSVNQQILTSESPTDSGWTEVTPVLGLSHNTPTNLAEITNLTTDFFATNDGRVGSFVRFDAAGFEVSDLSPNDYMYTANSLWLKCSVAGGSYVYEDQCAKYNPAAVIQLPQPIRLNHPDDAVDGGLPVAWAAFLALANKMGDDTDVKALQKAQIEPFVHQFLKQVGRSELHEAILNRPLLPAAAGFGIKSNVLTYGPWGSIANIGNPKAGKTNVKQDDGLNPWEYGGIDTMNAAGEEIAEFGTSEMQVAEEGSITVAGYPNTQLGAELLAAVTGPYADPNTSKHLVDNRVAGIENVQYGRAATTSGPCTTPGGGISELPIAFVDTDSFNGLYGPTITDITTQVGASQLTTTYRFRTWTPKFGVFARGNAERLKQFGQRRLSQQKEIRAMFLTRILPWIEAVSAPLVGPIRAAAGMANASLFGSAGYQSHMGAMRNAAMWTARWSTPRTTHDIIAGQKNRWNDGDYRYDNISSLPATEFAIESADDYDIKAYMSWDGLIRPVSIDGDGGLPPLIQPLSSNCQLTSNRGAQPPIDVEGSAGDLAEYNLNIDRDYLNPLANPNSLLPNRSDTPDHGHDVELLGRDSSLPNNSMFLRQQGFRDTDDVSESDYSNDYRFFALKGPMVLQQFGYDLDGFPVPNKVDSEAAASGGTFESANLEQKFMDGFLRKSHTWPVAPVDLRLDRDRGVWTIPQYRDLEVIVQEEIGCLESGLANQVSGPELYDFEGNVIETPQLIAKDVVGSGPFPSGTKLMVRFDPQECVYKIIESPVPRPLVYERDCCYDPDKKLDLDTPVPFSRLIFGQGIHAYTGISGECAVDTGNENGCTPTNDGDIYLAAGVTVSGGDFCKLQQDIETGDVELANRMVFGSGFRVGPGTDCEVKISYGIDIQESGDFCYPEGDNNLVEHANTFLIGRGLKIGPNPFSTGCEVLWAAGPQVEKKQYCNPDASGSFLPMASEWWIGDGLHFDEDLDNCLIKLFAGFGATSLEGCPTGDPPKKWNTINASKNIRFGGSEFACELTAGAFTKVNGNEAWAINFSGECPDSGEFEVQEGSGDCPEVTVALKLVDVTVVKNIYANDCGLYYTPIKLRVPCSGEDQGAVGIIEFTDCESGNCPYGTGL